MSEEKNKRLCQMLGVEFHDYKINFKDLSTCSCGLTGHIVIDSCTKANPDFYTDAGAVRLLRELEKWEHGKLFFAQAFYEGNNVEANDDDGCIERETITTPGLLADKVIERKEEKV